MRKSLFNGIVALISLVFFLQTQLLFAAKPLAPEKIEGVTIVSAAETIELILKQPELVLIDSRYHAEYSKGHIEGAVNIFNSDMTVADLQQLTENTATPLLFYCNGTRCLRSGDAASQAVKWGYKHVYWFRLGWLDWLDKQYPVEY